MTPHHQHQIDRDTVERLLDGAAVDRRRVPDDLVRLLDAVRAAPLTEELRGEHLAVRAFHTARLTPARRPSPHPALRGTLARLLAAKTTIAALAVAATGGMALATVQGVVPNPLRPAPPATTAPTHGPSPGSDPGRVRTSPTGKPPAPELVDSCRAWRDARATDPERTLRNPTFAPLVRAAGGRDGVDAWCDTVLGGNGTPGPPAGRPTTGPGAPASGRPHPSPSLPAAPTTRPAVPSTRPTGQLTVPTPLPTVPTPLPTVSTPPTDDLPGRPGHTTGPPAPVDALPEPTGAGGDTARR
ncbi:hypothetical protein [Micromonospora sagamiensis]|nr:hypothetical protein [Micromonospora sagamiensis]BCL16590.1 hypothetical protein GCM10017556_43290 [Micromonospora sagamiensis]